MVYSTIVGIDVHTGTNEVFALNRATGEARPATLPGEVDRVVEWVQAQGFEGPVVCVYESGPLGYGLARALHAAGFGCVVVATSKMPGRTGRRKNDRIDARRLARLYMAGELAEVWIPGEEAESLRSLSVLRGEAAKDLARAKQRVGSLLLFVGCRWEKGRKRWTKAFYSWAGGLALPFADRFVLDEKLAEVRHLAERLDGIEKELDRQAAARPGLTEAMARLMCVHGIGRVTAFALVCLAGDFRRFASGAAFASYLGLMPSEDSTGDSVRTGRITKAGNRYVRRLLMEAVNCYSRPFRRQRPEDLDPAVPLPVRVKAAACSERLRRRRAALVARKKSGGKIKCALARELAEWVYYIAVM